MPSASTGGRYSEFLNQALASEGLAGKTHRSIYPVPESHRYRQMIPTNSYASVYQEYLAAMKWMTSLGINLQT